MATAYGIDSRQREQQWTPWESLCVHPAAACGRGSRVLSPMAIKREISWMVSHAALPANGCAPVCRFSGSEFTSTIRLFKKAMPWALQVISWHIRQYQCRGLRTRPVFLCTTGAAGLAGFLKTKFHATKSLVRAWLWCSGGKFPGISSTWVVTIILIDLAALQGKLRLGIQISAAGSQSS